jgi:hypothetical protein
MLELHRHASGSDNDVLRLDLLRVAFVGLDGDLARCGHGPEALERRDLVSFHQHFHAAVHRLHDLVLARQHLREIEADVF